MRVSLIQRLRARLAGSARADHGLKYNLNDPRWGHRPNEDRKAQEGRRPGGGNDDDGPPELAELWRDFNQRLNRLLGKNGNGGGPYRPDARGVGLTVGVIGAIAALIWLASGAFVVQEGQVGVVTTFGKFSRLASPGFNWSWPAPFEAHVLVNTGRTNSTEIGYRANPRSRQPNESLMPTADGNLVDVQFSVQYKVKDPVAWVFNDRGQTNTVRDAGETVLRQLVGAGNLDAVLYDSRDKLASDARARIQQLADRYALGVDIVGVTIQSVAPPDQVAGAFDDIAKAQEDRTRERSEAQGFANDILPQAKERAAILLKNAETYRTNVVNEATGAAARFDQVVAQYAKAPAVMRDRMYIETMQQILSSTSKVVIDAKTGTNQIYLPLDRLLAQSAANEASIGSRSGVVPPVQQQGQAQGQPQAQAPSQPQPQQGQQPPQGQQTQPAQQPAQPADAPPATSGEAPRTRDLRSREFGRERESR